MDFRKIAAVLALSLAAGCSAPEEASETAAAGDPVRWKMTSTFPSSLIQLGTMGVRFSDQIKKVSGGNIEIRFFEPGALAPALEGFDAVSYGAIEVGWSTPGYWAGKEPALQLFGAVPFGPDAQEYIAWYYFGGGQEIYQQLYAKHNIHGIICGVTAPEASGWFKEEIKTVEDFRGKKIRFFGLGARVLNKLGANSQLLAAGDIYPALELGTIDGAEFSMPAVDYDMGFYQVAKNYYFPGWHQQSTMYEITINLDAWNSLSETQQVQIETTCGDNVRFGIAEGEALQFEAMKKLEAKGVSLREWSPEILAALEAAWLEVAAEMAAEDAEFARAWESLSAFRRDYKIWRDKGYL
ncbi:MAG: TRAP transporter substrate-binding protein [Proteobacteria bacterium]|nr:TRAP transporter substrate-binding protein [Pseudomonadota bacterium]